MKCYDVIIVGAGPAGMTAAIYAVRANMSVLMLDRLSPGGQIVNTNEIENYPGSGAVSGAELAISMFEHTQELGVEFDYKTVTSIVDNGEHKTVTCLEESSTFNAHAVILATGTMPSKLEVSGEDRFPALVSVGVQFVTEPSTVAKMLWLLVAVTQRLKNPSILPE